MKKLVFLFTLLLLFAVSTQAQWTTNAEVRTSQSGMTVYFVGTQDSTGGTYDSLVSSGFSLVDFDGADSLEYSYYLTNSAGLPRTSIYLWGSDNTLPSGGETPSSYIGAGNKLATLATADSSEVEVFGSVSLSGIRTKYHWVTVEQDTVVTGGSAGRDGTVFRMYLKLPKRDF